MNRWEREIRRERRITRERVSGEGEGDGGRREKYTVGPKTTLSEKFPLRSG